MPMMAHDYTVLKEDLKTRAAADTVEQITRCKWEQADEAVKQKANLGDTRVVKWLWRYLEKKELLQRTGNHCSYPSPKLGLSSEKEGKYQL